MHGKLLHLDIHIQFIHMTSHVYEQVFTGFLTGEWETGIPLPRIYYREINSWPNLNFFLGEQWPNPALL